MLGLFCDMFCFRVESLFFVGSLFLCWVFVFELGLCFNVRSLFLC